jgi:hypothetical protein
VFGGQHCDRLAQVRRPDGDVGRAPARDVWPDDRDELCVEESLPLAGAQPMPLFPCECLVRARLPPVPYWAVRATLDALDPHRVLAGLVPNAFLAPLTLTTPLGWLVVLVLLGELAVLVIVQVHRYRRVSSPLERQQTKWVVFVLAVFVTLGFGGEVPALIFPPLADPNSPSGSLYQLAVSTIISCLGFLIPLSFGFAMLRYRLWDIDLIINRTLVYGTLTASLALVYMGLVIGLQSLVHLLTGTLSEQPLVIVASTLAMAALFHPLRQRIQAIIDRRFYRRKYDAAKTVEAFSATLREEVDLDQLREQLLAVVQETMQPSHVSLWLRPSEHDGNQRALWRATFPVSSEGK